MTNGGLEKTYDNPSTYTENNCDMKVWYSMV